MLLIVNELVRIGIEDKLHKFDQNSYVHLRVFFFFNHKIGRTFLFIDFISIIIFYTIHPSCIMFFSCNKQIYMSFCSVCPLVENKIEL